MDNARQYQVVVNSEEQYSLPPQGWRGVSFKSTREHCLEHIRAIWTDMRPLSLRRAMDSEGISRESRG